MKLKMLGFVVLSTMALTAFGAGSASATTLEVGGVAQNKSVAITMSLEPGSSLLLSTTGGSYLQTCTQSTRQGTTSSPYSGSNVTGSASSLSFSKCTMEPVVVHKAGQLFVEHIPGTTDGTVFSENVEATVPSPIGPLGCKTGTGVHLGRITGKASGQATMDVNAVLNCGFLVPSARWTGAYVITSPTGLGVVS